LSNPIISEHNKPRIQFKQGKAFISEGEPKKRRKVKCLAPFACDFKSKGGFCGFEASECNQAEDSMMWLNLRLYGLYKGGISRKVKKKHK
jgi:hypothetical protein